MTVYICNNIDKATFNISSNSSKIQLLLSVDKHESLFKKDFFSTNIDLELSKTSLEQFSQTLESKLTDLISQHTLKYRTYKIIQFKGEKIHLNTRFNEDDNIYFIFSLYNMANKVKKYEDGVIYIYKYNRLLVEEKQILDTIQSHQEKEIDIVSLIQLMLAKNANSSPNSLLINIQNLQKKGFIYLKNEKVNFTLKPSIYYKKIS